MVITLHTCLGTSGFWCRLLCAIVHISFFSLLSLTQNWYWSQLALTLHEGTHWGAAMYHLSVTHISPTS